jgi:hypothetical protein
MPGVGPQVLERVVLAGVGREHVEHHVPGVAAHPVGRALEVPGLDAAPLHERERLVAEQLGVLGAAAGRDHEAVDQAVTRRYVEHHHVFRLLVVHEPRQRVGQVKGGSRRH